MALLECLEVNPSKSATASVIWLHGLGADGHDFEDIVPELNLPTVRFVFPHAPIRPVTINMGYPMRAWFDIFGLDEHSKQDEQGIRSIQQEIDSLIKHENTLNIPTNNIILAGFSQGGAVALYSGLRYPHKLAGILGLSTFLPLFQNLASEVSHINRTTPIFMGHGTEDPVVPLRFGQISYDALSKLGYSVEWRSYPMAHAVCPQEIRDIREWINRALIR